jgi:hypothetical protein
MNLLEGGNVFKDNNGRAQTQRINQTDVKSTLAWLEELVPGLDLPTEQYLGIHWHQRHVRRPRHCSRQQTSD